MNSPQQDCFYKDLPVREDFSGVADGGDGFFSAAPDDWYLAVTDLEGSTAAIERGLYKEVNLINASAILAVLNVCGFDAVPFVFGGDGATILIPARHRDAVYSALSATRDMARDEFGLTLRIGMLSVADIRHRGRDVAVAKVRLSANFCQAAFSGGGAALAEHLLKACPADPAFYNAVTQVAPAAAFKGLECRWQRIAGPKEEIVAIIVQARGGAVGDQQRLYGEVLRRIEEIYGSPEESRPIVAQQMHLTLNRRDLRGEHSVRSFRRGWLYRLWYHIEVRLMVVTGMFLMKTGLSAVGVNWSKYMGIAAANTDYRKFDDQIKQVLSGSADQRQRLTDYLNGLQQRGAIYYGIHASPSAFITCLISNYDTRHFHLVDGAEGGYTLAAKTIKEQQAAERGTPGS